MIFFPPAEDQQFQMSRWPELVFKGPVHRTEKSPKTELDQTDQDQTGGCSCMHFKQCKWTDLNQLQLVSKATGCPLNTP